MSEDTMMGTNEAYGRVKRMMGQSNTGSIQYPSGTNSRGSGGREHHAEGDMVGRESHSHGDRVGDSSSAPGRGGSMMKPHFGAPQGGREMGTRRKAIAQVHGENHKEGDMVGREEHGFGQRVGRSMGRMANQASGNARKMMRAAPGTLGQTGTAVKNAAKKVPGMANQAGKAVSGAMRGAGNAMQKAMPPRPMYRRGGRTENMHDED